MPERHKLAALARSGDGAVPEERCHRVRQRDEAIVAAAEGGGLGKLAGAAVTGRKK